MPTTPPMNFPGSASLAGTCRALSDAQKDSLANLKTVEGVINERTNGERVNVNVAIFDRVRRPSQVRDEMLCFDVSTAAGSTNANAARATHTFVGEFRMFVSNQLKQIQIFTRKSAD